MSPNLAKRALNLIDELMHGLKYISLSDYAELNDVLIALRAESEKAQTDNSDNV